MPYLVGPNLVVKIADFGLARGVHDKDYYRVAGKQLLPVRSMSPESLLFGVFSTAGDVWYRNTCSVLTAYKVCTIECLSTENICSCVLGVTGTYTWSLQMYRSFVCKLYNLYRSYGVLLWEIVSYGDVPLVGFTTESIIEEAHKQTLKHFP